MSTEKNPRRHPRSAAGNRDEVTVFYDAIDPQDSYVLEDKVGNLTGILIVVFGALGIILAIILKTSGAM